MAAAHAAAVPAASAAIAAPTRPFTAPSLHPRALCLSLTPTPAGLGFGSGLGLGVRPVSFSRTGNCSPSSGGRRGRSRSTISPCTLAHRGARSSSSSRSSSSRSSGSCGQEADADAFSNGHPAPAAGAAALATSLAGDAAGIDLRPLWPQDPREGLPSDSWQSKITPFSPDAAEFECEFESGLQSQSAAGASPMPAPSATHVETAQGLSSSRFLFASLSASAQARQPWRMPSRVALPPGFLELSLVVALLIGAISSLLRRGPGLFAFSSSPSSSFSLHALGDKVSFRIWRALRALGFDWAENVYGGRGGGKVVRDRSLGGREVIVSKYQQQQEQRRRAAADRAARAKRERQHQQAFRSKPYVHSPLDPVAPSSLSERDMKRLQEGNRKGGAAAAGSSSLATAASSSLRGAGSGDELEFYSLLGGSRTSAGSLSRSAAPGGGRSSGSGRTAVFARLMDAPTWWRFPASPPSLAVGVAAREVAKHSLDRHAREMVAARLLGQDFAPADILQLYEAWKVSGTVAPIETDNTRDELFRAAISMSIATCFRAGGGSGSGASGAVTADRLPPADVPRFLAGVGTALGLPPSKALTMVLAAIAVRTRSSLLQAWALLKQNRGAEAEGELQGLCGVLCTLTPPDDSAELEMVARGLESRIVRVEREELLWRLSKCNRKLLPTLEYALGLV